MQQMSEKIRWNMKIYIQIAAALITVGIMAACAVEDLRRKEIQVMNLTVFVLMNVLMAWFNQNNWKVILVGSFLGMLFWGISICTEEKIGKGDAIFIGGIGIYLGFWLTLVVVFSALILVCLYGLISMKKENGWSYEIAFVPFLLVPYASIVIFQLYTGCQAVC